MAKVSNDGLKQKLKNWLLLPIKFSPFLIVFVNFIVNEWKGSENWIIKKRNYQFKKKEFWIQSESLGFGRQSK